MTDSDPATEVFGAERPRLVGLAYRLLGSVADADDVVQEAWFRWSTADHDAIERPAAWLTTVVSRLGLDRLRSRRREQVDYVGPWLPEPLVRPLGDEPEQATVLADSLTTTFLVMLERLSPEERLVLLLVDVFGEPFHSVATLLDRSDEACRQLAVRARKKLADIRERTDHHRTSQGEQLAIATAFVGAVMNGDLQTVTAMLTSTAVMTNDGGANHRAARRPITGPDRIARFMVNLSRRLPAGVEFDPVWVNGSPGVVLRLHGAPYMVNVLDIVDGLVDRQYWIVNPDKLVSIGMDIELV
ncbi:MAG: polymerase, sigma-24 subunit, subfamily [Ilumatobacteraceae bacterium]|nr:polymerase, sigma-24 subunit, subfamily [Ilumatobacteraceae bacterium]